LVVQQQAEKHRQQQVEKHGQQQGQQPSEGSFPQLTAWAAGWHCN
jgi:hypothetical protein